jgi:hypothetical protein
MLVRTASREEAGDVTTRLSRSGADASFGLEEAFGGVDGSVFSEAGECDSCDERG